MQNFLPLSLTPAHIFKITVQKSDPNSSIAFSLLGSLPCHLQQARTHTHSTNHPQSYQPHITKHVSLMIRFKAVTTKAATPSSGPSKGSILSVLSSNIFSCVNSDVTLPTLSAQYCYSYGPKIMFKLNCRMSVFCV
jgi:hypothetical protein